MKKSKQTIIMLLVLLTNVCVLVAQEQSGETTVQVDSINFEDFEKQQQIVVKRNPRGAMLRSIFVPGWGQFYNEKKFKAVVISGTEVALVINAFVQNQLAINAVTTLDKEFYINNRNMSYWWLVGVVLYSAIDAYVDAHLFNFDESPDLSMNIKPIYDGPFAFSQVTTISLEWRF